MPVDKAAAKTSAKVACKPNVKAYAAPGLGLAKALREIVPSTEELAEAKALLAQAGDNKVEKSKMACLVSWCKKRDDGTEEVGEILNSKAEQRREWMLKHMVLMAREKKKHTVVSRIMHATTDNKSKKGWRT